MSSVATSPIKPTQEEQSLTPPGKVITISTRSPGCTRNQSALRNNKTFSPAAASSSSGELLRFIEIYFKGSDDAFLIPYIRCVHHDVPVV